MKIVCGMATFPPRIPYLAECLASIVPQVDETHVYVNGLATLPSGLPVMPGLRWHHGRDWGAAAKFGFTSGADVYLCADDDMVWHEDYVRLSLRALEERPDALLCWHGSQVFAPYTFYRDSRRSFPGKEACMETVRVHCPGTGVSFFRPEAVPLTPLAARRPLQIDACIGAWLAERGIESWHVAHQHWMYRATRAHLVQSIKQRTSRDSTPVDDVIREARLWEVPL